MKTAITAFIIFLVIVTLWEIEIQTALPPSEVNLIEAFALVPFIVLAFIARIFSKEISEALNQKR